MRVRVPLSALPKPRPAKPLGEASRSGHVAGTCGVSTGVVFQHATLGKRVRFPHAALPSFRRFETPEGCRRPVKPEGHRHLGSGIVTESGLPCGYRLAVWHLISNQEEKSITGSNPVARSMSP